MDSSFSQAVSALKYVPEEMQQRALVVAEKLDDRDRTGLLRDLQETENVLKKNVEEQKKLLDEMELLVMDVEKGYSRMERTGAEGRSQAEDERYADALFPTET